MPHVGQRPAAKLVPSPEDGVRIAGMVRPVARRPQPQRPVEPGRHRRLIRRDRGVLGPHGAVRPVMNLAQGADGAAINPALDFLDVRAVAGGEKMRGHLCLPGPLDHPPRLQQAVGQRFMHHDVLALFHRRNRHRRMQVVGGHHLDGIHIPLLRQQLAKIGVGCAAPELLLRPLAGIDGFHHLPGHFAPPGDARLAAPPIRLAQHLGDRRAMTVPGPVQVVVPVLDRITHGNDLNLGQGEQAWQFPQPLRAATDQGQGNFFAGRHKPRASQHPPRHNRKRRRRCPARHNELPPGNPGRTGLMARLACFHGPSLAQNFLPRNPSRTVGTRFRSAARTPLPPPYPRGIGALTTADGQAPATSHRQGAFFPANGLRSREGKRVWAALSHSPPSAGHDAIRRGAYFFLGAGAGAVGAGEAGGETVAPVEVSTCKLYLVSTGAKSGCVRPNSMIFLTKSFMAGALVFW